MKKIFIMCCIITSLHAVDKNIYQKEKMHMLTRTQTESGIEYEIIRSAQGVTDVEGPPVDGQKISIHYIGWIDNNDDQPVEFDNSYKRNIPFTFVLGKDTARGWDEVLRNVKVGEVARLHVPFTLAYGEKGIPGVIPPFANLIFEIELLAIKA